jgi:hypothetical protein
MNNHSSIKIISPAVHGLLDYLLVVMFLLAPSLLAGISGGLAVFIYTLAVVHLVLTVITRSPAGLFSVVPLRIHGLVELLVSIALIISPWILGFSGDIMARNLLVILGILIFIIWIFTDYGFRPEANGESATDEENSDRQASESEPVSPSHHA